MYIREDKTRRGGFTLAELLIVVAIIAVLVAIAIPVFTNQLEKSREATDQANVRSAYANVMAQYLTNADESYQMSVTPKQTQPSWQGPKGQITTQIDGVEGFKSYDAHTVDDGKYIIKITKSGTFSIT